MFHRRLINTAIAGLALTLLGASPALAQPAGTDFTAAPAGNYTIDVNHTAVVARVPHFGFSYEIFRFTPVSGSLTWNPAAPTSSALNVVVDATSIQTPVNGFAEELRGQRFLNTTQFPQATFVSTAFRQTDATHGQVDGNLTIKGVTKPVTFNVELVGAGNGQHGPVIGVHAVTTINNSDYSLPGFISGQSEIVIDAEFGKH